ncbi:MAG: ATP-dependent zinc metalloprotease FtsH [Actinomycetota bacterium]|nr:ATP-dependent zinc metalloprotease FtsH [Actinomycetota bacterium]
MPSVTKKKQDPKKPGAQGSGKTPFFETAFGKVVKKFKPRWPGFKKMFGPLLVLLIFTLLATFFFLINQIQPERPGQELTLTKVYELADQGLISEAHFKEMDSNIVLKVAQQPTVAPAPAATTTVTAPGTTAAPAVTQTVEAKAKPPKTAWVAEPESGAMTSIIEDKLRNSPSHTQISWDHQDGKRVLRFVAQFLVPLLILASVFSFFFLIITGSGGGASDFLGFSKFAAKIQRRKKGVKGTITFKDIAAIDEGITELQEVVDYLMNPGQFAEVGARAPKGVLLAGPPGTGKTLLAKAVAGEAGVPFIQLSGSEFVESLVGVGAARVRSLFAQAREMAPCIIFIDELDAAGRMRGAGVGGGNDEREQTLNQLLVEMDGFSSSLGVAVLGATNRPDILDPALLRPGRFDRQIVIDVPDVRGREEILKVHARGRPMSPDCELSSIAKQCPGFTGAELANILNEAALLAVRRHRSEIVQQDLEEAVDRVLAGPERKSHILTDDEKLLIAYHEAGHAVVARGAGQETGVLKLSIVARGLQLGHASTFSSADRMIMLRSEIEGQLTTLLGGLAAEKLLFGEMSTGNTGDLQKATTLARKVVATYGMTDEVGTLQVLHEGAVFMGRDFAASQSTSGDILNKVDREIRKILDKAEEQAVTICKANKSILDEIVTLLLERETMAGPELEPLLSKVKRLELPKPLAAFANRSGNGGPKPAKHRAARAVDIAAPDVIPDLEI